MSSISMQPLLSHTSPKKNPINPQEFWPAFRSLSKMVADLVGGVEQRDKIPIYLLEDLKGRIHQSFLNKVTITQIDHPIEIYFVTNDKGKSGIGIAYKIKRVLTPKYRCLKLKLQKAIELVDMGSPENRPGDSYFIGKVIKAFGPASETEPHFLSSLQKLFSQKSYQVKRGCLAECFSLYKPSRIQLDT